MSRPRGKGEALRAEIAAQECAHDSVVLVCDLGRQADIRRVVEEFQVLGEPLHALINNAGVITMQREEGERGIERMFSVNHLGHFLLTLGLLETLKASAPARVITVASDAHTFCNGIRFDDLAWHDGFKVFKTYGHSKLANVLFTRALAKRLDGSGVTAHCLDPGPVATSLGVQNGWYVPLLYLLLRPFLRSPAKGAQTTMYLAGTANAPTNGGYYKNSQLKALKPPADDDDMAEALWEVSAQLVDTEF